MRGGAQRSAGAPFGGASCKMYPEWHLRESEAENGVGGVGPGAAWTRAPARAFGLATSPEASDLLEGLDVGRILKATRTF